MNRLHSLPLSTRFAPSILSSEPRLRDHRGQSITPLYIYPSSTGIGCSVSSQVFIYHFRKSLYFAMHLPGAPWYFFYVIFTFVNALSPSNNCVASIRNSRVIGHASTTQPTVCEWLGVPYAAAPIGDLRFAPPVRLPLVETINADNFVRFPLTNQEDEVCRITNSSNVGLRLSSEHSTSLRVPKRNCTVHEDLS